MEFERKFDLNGVKFSFAIYHDISFYYFYF